MYESVSEKQIPMAGVQHTPHLKFGAACVHLFILATLSSRIASKSRRLCILGATLQSNLEAHVTNSHLQALICAADTEAMQCSWTVLGEHCWTKSHCWTKPMQMLAWLSLAMVSLYLWPMSRRTEAITASSARAIVFVATRTL